jgi:hypothetical protein
MPIQGEGIGLPEKPLEMLTRNHGMDLHKIDLN